MVKMKTCCFCFRPKTGTIVIGCLSIISSILCMIPFIIVLGDSEFYIGEFIKDQRAQGVADFPDSDIPAFSFFIEVAISTIVSMQVIYTLASILLIAGASAQKRFLIVPWLVSAFSIIIFFIVLVLALMFSFASNFSCVILSIAAPFLLLGFYFWFTVYSTYHQIRKATSCSNSGGNNGGNNGGTTSIESRNLLSTSSSSSSGSGARVSASSSVSVRGTTRGRHSHEEAHSRTTVTSCGDPLATTPVSVATVTGSSSSSSAGGSPAGSGSLSSLASVKLSLKRAVGATPPPPYEAVALDIDKEEAALAQGIVDQKDLTFTTSGVISSSSSNASHKALLQQQLAALRRSASNSSKSSKSSKSSLESNSSSGSNRAGSSRLEGGARKGAEGTNKESRSLPEDLQGLDSIFVCPEEDDKNSSSSGSARTSFSVDHGVLSRATGSQDNN